MKPIKWLDIALHTVPALLWAAAAGYACGFGWSYGSSLGVLLFGLSLLALPAGILFWMTRELFQHNRWFGGRQSQLEWMIPAGVQLVAFTAAFIIAI